MPVFTGSGVAIITPMNEDQTVNYSKLEELINYHIDHGTDAIIITGTTGESPTLSEEEHKDVIKAAVDFTAGRIPVVAGTGSNSTLTAIQLTQAAEKAGADAALVVTPYYNKATQKGLIEHYEAIADATKLPIIVYNVPSRTGTNVLPQTMARLFHDRENIVGLKEATGNMSQASETMRLCDGKLELYSGEDGLVVPLLSIGGLGVISVIANIAPQHTHDMVQAFFDGDVKRAARMQLESLDMVNSLFCEVNPIPVKTAMNMLGADCGPLRAPMCQMEPENAARLKASLDAFEAYIDL